MPRDAKELVIKCEKFRNKGMLIHLHAEEMGTIHTPCVFARWDVDLVGVFPIATGKKFLIVVANYFNKWVEAIALTKIDEKNIIRFLWTNIYCRSEISRILVSNNGTRFNEAIVQAWCEEMGTTQRFTSVAHPQTNG